MKRKLIPLITALICVIICAFAFTACEKKEINYLKADAGDGQLKTEIDLGEFTPDQIGEVKNKLAALTFYYEYYPDNSTEKANMDDVKIKYFAPDGSEHAGLPDALQADEQNASHTVTYTVYYYYKGHEPTADFSDSFVIKVAIGVKNGQ